MKLAEKKKFKFSFTLDPVLCMACAACELECKDDGIFINDNVAYDINADNCTRCGKCFRACPAGAIAKVTNVA